jgi:hypothetical protein
MNLITLLPAFNAPWREKFAGHAGEWSDGTLFLESTRSPVFLMRYTPHFKDIFAALNNRLKKRVHIMMPAGSGKSMIGEITILFVIDNDPRGLIYWVWPNDDDASDQVEDRLMPIIAANRFLAKRLPSSRSKRRATKIIFPDITFQAVGANESNAQRVRASFLFLEEPHLFKPGFMAKFRKRLVGSREGIEATFSTGSVLEDESDAAWKESSCSEAAVKCPACGEYHIPKDDCLKWDKNETTWSEETHEYRVEKLRETIRYEFSCCGHAFKPSWNRTEGIDEDRLALIQDYKWIPQNPNASDEIDGYHANFFFTPWLRLEDIALEKIRATHAAHRGQLEMLKDYVQKVLAEAWDEAPRDSDRNAVKSGYVLGEKWDAELTRFLSFDRQKDYFVGICRAYGPDSTSRLIWCGRLETFEQIEEMREKLGVERRRTGIDRQFDTNQVDQFCLKYGWLGFSAMDTMSFPHPRPKMKPLHLPYSTPQRGHVGLGLGGKPQVVVYFLWSNPQIKDLWHNMKNNPESGYTSADDAGPIYEAQTKSEYKRQITTPGGAKVWRYHTPQHKDDHFGSAEQINCVMACMDSRLAIGKANLVLESVEEGFNQHLVNK